MKAGDKIRIIRMDGEPQYDGKTGTITHIDDAGQIHGSWGGCALIPGVDEYEVIDHTALKATAFILGIYMMLYAIMDIIEAVFDVAI